MLLLNAKGLAKDPVSARPPVVWRLVRIVAPYNCSHGNGTVEYSIVFCNGGSACVTSVVLSHRHRKRLLQIL
jgi:hypothetical protein